MTTDYATENALVDTDWAQAHANDLHVRFVEVDDYDGSWTEYGSLIGVPIEKPVAVGVAD